MAGPRSIPHLGWADQSPRPEYHRLLTEYGLRGYHSPVHAARRRGGRWGAVGSSGSLRSTWCQPCDTKDSLSIPVDTDLGPQLMPLRQSSPSRSLTKGLLPTGAWDGKGGSANLTSSSAAANTPLVQCPRVCATVLSSCTSYDAPDNTERWRLLLSCSTEQTKAQSG